MPHTTNWRAPTYEGHFWSLVNKTPGCWEWIGRFGNAGYGQVKRNGKNKGAHRISYELTHGAIPAGLCVLHRCDNRKCVRPDHLFLGTKRDNTRDMIQKGRAKKPYTNRTRCRNGHELAVVGTVRGKKEQGAFDTCRKCYEVACERSGKRQAARRKAERAAKRQGVAA